MSYDPTVYQPNSTRTVFTTVDGVVNNAITTGDRIVISSTGFSHDDATVNASGQIVFTGGEHVICAAIETTRDPLSGSTETPLEFRWYDVTNSQWLGVAGRSITQTYVGTNSLQSAPCCIAYVDSAITVEIRCQAQSGNTSDAYNNLGLTYIGNPWGYIYSAIG